MEQCRSQYEDQDISPIVALFASLHFIPDHCYPYQLLSDNHLSEKKSCWKSKKNRGHWGREGKGNTQCQDQFLYQYYPWSQDSIDAHQGSPRQNFKGWFKQPAWSWGESADHQEEYRQASEPYQPVAWFQEDRERNAETKFHQNWPVRTCGINI